MASRKQSDVDYEAVGRLVFSLNDVYADKKKLYRTAFVKGLFSGLGGVIGATVLVAMLLWSLSLFKEVPLIGNFVDSVKETVDNGN